MTYYRALLSYENGGNNNQKIELLKEFCEMSFETVTKPNHSVENETCCACDEAVYEVN